MGLFDKLKNVFFEEEYVEVEEPKKSKKEIKQEKVPVAKKIELPEIKKAPLKEEEEESAIVEEEVKVEEEKEEEPKFKFPMVFEDDDFKQEMPVSEKKIPIVEEQVSKEEIKEVSYHFENERVPLYEGREEKKDKPIFRPTPIISPIYGILDKNYKKEEIVTKKPIVLSQSSSKKVDFDSIRQKAYGDLANDITESMMDDGDSKDDTPKIRRRSEKHEQEIEEKDEDENTFYDLNVDSPAVNKVTVGDAEEYFNDLGLEYNVDYKDNSTEKTSKTVSSEEKSDQPLENNLFDLLETMYEDKEEEE